MKIELAKVILSIPPDWSPQKMILDKFLLAGHLVYQSPSEDRMVVVYNDGSAMWLREGKLGRDDGPAITDPDGQPSTFINSIYLDQG